MLRRCVVLLGLILLTGCGGGLAEVTGVVRYDNKPLNAGSVTIVGDDGKPHFGAIGAEGRYSVLDVPRGAVRIAVKSHAPVPPAFLTKGEKQTVITIPSRYEKVETSGLETTVNRRVFKHDIPLTP